MEKLNRQQTRTSSRLLPELPLYFDQLQKLDSDAGIPRLIAVPVTASSCSTTNKFELGPKEARSTIPLPLVAPAQAAVRRGALSLPAATRLLRSFPLALD